MISSQLKEKVQQYAEDKEYRVKCAPGCKEWERGYRPPFLFEHIIHKHARITRNWHCKDCTASFFGTLDTICHAEKHGHKIGASYIDHTIADFHKLDKKGKDEQRAILEEPYFVYGAMVAENVVQRLIEDGYLQPGPKLRESRKRVSYVPGDSDVPQNGNNETAHNHDSSVERSHSVINYDKRDMQVRFGKEKHRGNFFFVPKRQSTPPKQQCTPFESQEKKMGKMTIKELAQAIKEKEAVEKQSSYSGTQASKKPASILQMGETRHWSGTVRQPPVRSMHRDFSEFIPPHSPRRSIYPSSPRSHADLSPYASPRTSRYNDDENEIFMVPNRFAQARDIGENTEKRMEPSGSKNAARTGRYFS